jgi:hypothetical protein
MENVLAFHIVDVSFVVHVVNEFILRLLIMQEGIRNYSSNAPVWTPIRNSNKKSDFYKQKINI